MEPKTFFILLAVGMSGLIWSIIRTHPKYLAFGEAVMVGLGFTPYTECLNCTKKVRYGDQCCEHSMQIIPDNMEDK
jgi:hypothetical protein